MKRLLTAIAIAASLLTSTTANAADDFNKCSMRSIMKSQTNAGAMVAHSNVVLHKLKDQIRAAISASEDDRADKVDELLTAAVEVVGTVTRKPVNDFMTQSATMQSSLLTLTLAAAVEADEPVMQKALISNSVNVIIMAALTPCNM